MLDMIVAEPKELKASYMDSPEYKALLETARNQKFSSYTVIYRDKDGELKESWHYLCEMSLDFVKEKYRKAKMQVVHFGPKELPYGDYLKSIMGNSRE